MKYPKEIKRILNAREDKTALVGFAVISGLAVGAALVALLAPKKVKELRSSISDAGNRLCGTLDQLIGKFRSEDHEQAEAESAALPGRSRGGKHKLAHKKAKSDISEIIHQRHHPEDLPEQA